MTSSYNFFKLQGAGNDFILFDAAYKAPPVDLIVEKASWICDRHLGVGGDGILFLSPHEGVEGHLRYFNRDGSEVAFCGNGLRACSWYISQKHQKDGSYQILFGSTLFLVEVAQGYVSTPMPPPSVYQRWVWQTGREVALVLCGVPHLIVFMRQEEHIDVNYWGKIFAKRCREELLVCKIEENSPLLGVNINFVWVIDRQTIEVRTYENGVEEETLSCASGSSAAGFFAHVCDLVDSRVFVKRGDESLFQLDIEEKKLSLTGSAEIVFEGVLPIAQGACQHKPQYGSLLA